MSGSRPVDLRKGEADVALRSGALDDDLVAKKVGEFDWSLYASEAYLARHPIGPDALDLTGHALLNFEASAGGAPVSAWLERRGGGARGVMRCREVSDLIAACAAGVGLAALPCVLASTEPSLRRLTQERVGSSRLSLVHRKEAANVESVRTVIKFMSEIMRRYDRAASPRPGPTPRGALRRPLLCLVTLLGRRWSLTPRSSRATTRPAAVRARTPTAAPLSSPAGRAARRPPPGFRVD